VNTGSAHLPIGTTESPIQISLHSPYTWSYRRVSWTVLTAMAPLGAAVAGAFDGGAVGRNNYAQNLQ
jgi:hypothetical protein